MQQPAVFGVPVYTTDTTEAKDSPTRLVHRQYSGSTAAAPGTEQLYGTPTFFSGERAAAAETEARSPGGEQRPVLSVLREILRTNKSYDAAQQSGARDHYDISRHFHSGHTAATAAASPGPPAVYKHTEDPELRLPASSTQQPAGDRGQEGHEAGDGDGDGDSDGDQGDYEDRFKQIWPYRTDDKYSLFYFHPSQEQPPVQEEADEAAYPWPSLSDLEPEEDIEEFQPRHPQGDQGNLNRGTERLVQMVQEFSALVRSGAIDAFSENCVFITVLKISKIIFSIFSSLLDICLILCFLQISRTG